MRRCGSAPIPLALALVAAAVLTPAAASAQGGAPPPPAAASPEGGAAAQVPVLSSHGKPVSDTHPPQSAASSRLAFDLPAVWTSEKPESSMRLAQATIPGVPGTPGGKTGPGQFAIFYFGPGGGGSAEANITRWIGQMDAPIAPPHRAELTAHGLQVSWVEVAGTLKASTVGMGPSQAQPGWRLLGAVVEGPGGPWYIKAVGPDATIAAARGAFLNLLTGLRPR
jgi:hypothetical protein